MTGSKRPDLRGVGDLRWPPAAAVAICVVLGTLLPAAFGAVTGIPEPLIHDERSYILGADTFARGRLTNPSPALPEFFEAPHILVTPTYQSKYPPGQSAVLALGTIIMGDPIWGVWIGCGLFAGCLCWMLQAWVPRRWAFVVTVMSAATLGTTTYWAQSYWGGMIAAGGAALVFGGLRRTLRSPTVVSSAIMGIGVVVIAMTRPFEGFLALLPSAMLLARWLFVNRALTLQQRLTRFILPAGTVVAIGLACMAGYNQAVTGNPWRTPYQTSLDQYFYQGVFVFSPLRIPERQQVERIAAIHQPFAIPPVENLELAKRVAAHLVMRVPTSIGSAFGLIREPREGKPHYAGVLLWMALLLPLLGQRPGRTFVPILAGGMVVDAVAWLYLPAGTYPLLLAPLFVAAAWMYFDRRLTRTRWIGFFAATVATVSVGQAFVAWWFPHYIAPLVPVVLAGIAISVHRAAVRSSIPPQRLGLGLAMILLAHVGTASLVHVVLRSERSARPEESYGARRGVISALTREGGRHLVFVRYTGEYSIHQEWVYNAADLNDAPIVFAHDLGEGKNSELMALYPGRHVWRLHVSPETTRLESHRLTAE